MKSWSFRFLAKLYPKTWRERYGEEVSDLSAELLAAHEVTRPLLALELVRSAFAERVHSWNRAHLAATLSASTAVVVVLVAALLATNDFGLGATNSPRVTPSGWDSLAYGDAQLSFPPSFVKITPRPGGGGQVLFDNSSTAYSGPCLGPLDGTVVCLSPMSHVPPAYAGEKPTTINAVSVYLGAKGDYYAPSLSVEVTASGPLARRIVDTLAPSRMRGCKHVPRYSVCFGVTVSLG